MQDSMFFFPLDFWVATHLVVYPKSRRRLGSHGFGHYYLKAVKKNLSIFIMSLHYDNHVIFHGLTKSPPWGSRSTQDLCKRNATEVFQEEKIWWKVVEVSWLNFSQGRLGALRLNLKHVF